MTWKFWQRRGMATLEEQRKFWEKAYLLRTEEERWLAPNVAARIADETLARLCQHWGVEVLVKPGDES